jgi:hypothetical protein
MQMPAAHFPLLHCGSRVHPVPDAWTAMHAVPLHQKLDAQLMSPVASLLGHEVPQAVTLAHT